YMVVENALDTFQAPPAPSPAGQQLVDTATRAASLTSQLITAQSNLYTAHFNMTTYWISYLNTRDQLYRDLELMPLDYRGVWIDNVATCECPSDNKDNGKADSQETLPAPKELPPAPQRPARLPEPSLAPANE